MVRSKIKLVVGVRYSLYKVIRTFHDHRARVCRKVRLMLSSQEMFRKLSVTVVLQFMLLSDLQFGLNTRLEMRRMIRLDSMNC